MPWSFKKPIVLVPLAIVVFAFFFAAVFALMGSSIEEQQIWVPLLIAILGIILMLYGAQKEKGLADSVVKEFRETAETLGETKAELADTTKALALREEKIKELEEELERRGESEALEHFKKGDYGKAEELFKKEATEGKDKAGKAFYYLGDIEFTKLNFKEALNYYAKAIKETPENSRYLNSAGIVRHTLGEHKKAIEYYEQALAIFKKFFNGDHPYVKGVKASLEKARLESSK